MTQSDYRKSVKCKYCSHFHSDFNRCKRGGYTFDTTPDSVCKSFTLSPTDVIFQKVLQDESHGLPQRGDGSYITEMPQFMKDEFEREEQKESLREGLLAAIVIGIGLLIFWLIFGPFIIGICKMIFGILNFLS